MSQRIYIGVPTLSRTDLLARLLKSIAAQTVAPAGLMVVDNSDSAIASALLPDEGIFFHFAEGRNLGVARSWNRMLRQLPAEEDALLITNDDNLLHPRAVEKFRDLAEANPRHAYFSSATGGFSCFCLRRSARSEVGEFDENFYPAYFEDNDYHRRMRLKGLEFMTTDIEIYELGVAGIGSQTLHSTMTAPKDVEAIRLGYIANERYYESKWGGAPGTEKHATPFGIQPPLATTRRKLNTSIFVTWQSRQFSPALSRCFGSQAAVNPGWNVSFYDDRRCEEFMADAAHWSACGWQTWKKYPTGVLRADIWRCAALFKQGGVYCDLNLECLRPLDALLAAAIEARILRDDTEVLLTTDHPVHERLHWGGRRMYMNDFMVALKPGSELFRRYLERVGENSDERIERLKRDPVMLTGPGVLTDLIEEAGGPEALKIGVLPWQWVHPLPDMTLDFPKWEQYDALIRSGDWFLKLETPPFAAHYWWHSYCSEHNMMNMYGDLLFQGEGVLVERRLEKFVDLLGERAETMGTALAEFAERFGSANDGNDARTVLELGVTGSFVAGAALGYANTDRQYWKPSEPENWDWSAGAFTRVAAEVLQGLGVTYHGIDPKPEAIEISRAMFDGLHGDFRFHEKKAAKFLKEWHGKAGSVGLVYMNHGDVSEEAAWMHADDARRILASGMLAQGALVLIDDHAVAGDDAELASHPRSRYSRALFEQAGFKVLVEGVQLLLEAPKAPLEFGRIPKVIHQTWKTRSVGEPFQPEWIASWKDLNAADGWEYRFWTDEELEEFVANEFPGFLSTYQEYDVPIKRVDAVRYLILKRFGGVFVNLDFACLRPLEPLLEDLPLLFGCQNADVRKEGIGANGVCNAFMASAPGHPFWDNIEESLYYSRNEEILVATGPNFLTTRVRNSMHTLPVAAHAKIVRRELLYPFEWSDKSAKQSAMKMSLEELRNVYPEAYGVTFWTATWKPSEADLKAPSAKSTARTLAGTLDLNPPALS